MGHPRTVEADSAQPGPPPRRTTQWTYDLRGLDMVAWARRAGLELAELTRPDQSITLLVGDAALDELDALRAVLATAGCFAREDIVLGIRTLGLTATAPPAAGPPHEEGA